MQLCQVGEGRLFGQTLDHLILAEGESLLNMYTSGRSLEHNATKL